MSMRINPPTFGENYERYKQELYAWQEVTNLDKSKQGIAIALSLPEEHPRKLREKVFDELSLADLKEDTGLETLITFLDTQLKVDDLSDCFNKYEHFEDCRRSDGQSMNDFIAEYDLRYNKISKKKIILPQEILAFKLLKCANITRDERLLVLTGIDYAKKDTLYEQAKQSLKKFKGQQVYSACASGGACGSAPIKFEPTFLAENEEALLAAGYVRRNTNTWRQPSSRGGRSFFDRRGAGRGRGTIPKNTRERNINPDGPDGKPLTCIACGSYRHLLRSCPDSWENLAKVNVTEMDNVSDEQVFFTGYDKEEVTRLGVIASNCAVLDSACSSTVCGKEWLDNYITSLDERDRATVIHQPGSRVFKFGGGTILKSEGEYNIPATIVGKAVRIKTDVVSSYIPLLLSKDAMKKAGVKLDTTNDSAEIFGKDVSLNKTTSGHYCIPLDDDADSGSVTVKERLDDNVTKYMYMSEEIGDDDPHVQSGPQAEANGQGVNENLVQLAKDGAADMRPKACEKIVLKPGDAIRYRHAGNNDWTPVTVLGRATKATGPNCNWYNISHGDGTENSVDLGVLQWEKLDPNESHVVMTLVPKTEHDSQDCIAAKYTELEKLIHFGTYEEVEDIGQNCVSTRWVLWYKGTEVRARLVDKGFEEEANIQRDSPTVGKSVVRLLLATAASRGWKVKTTDIKSAFSQSRQLDSEVFLTPPPEAAAKPGCIWRLLKCLYGFNDAARQFYHSVVDELKSLGCTQSTLDPALYFKHGEGGELIGILVSHINDFLHAGDEQFDRDIIDGLRNRFLAGKLEEEAVMYIGFRVKQGKYGIMLDQNKYVEDIHVENLSSERSTQKDDCLSERERTQYRSLAVSINWVVCGTRPDLAFEFMDLSTKFNKEKIEDLVKATKVVRKLRGENSAIFFPYLGPSSEWSILVFTDAAHANLCDGVSSAMASVVFLVGEGRVCCPISWGANKIRRIVRSTLAAEALSLQVGLEEAIYIRTMVKELLGGLKSDLPIIAYVDNRSVVEALHTTKLVDDHRLRIDISAIKQSLDSGEIAAVRWIPGDIQLANCLTKGGASGRQLLAVFQSGKMLLDV